MKSLAIIILTFFSFSCAFHRGDIETVSFDDPVVYEDLSIGTSSSARLFGIGGVAKDALIFEAKRNMVNNRPLVGNEQYGNTTVDIKETFYLIGHKTKVTVVADIVTKKENPLNDSYSETYLKKINKDQDKDSLFAIGDSVLFNKDLYAVINNFTRKDKAVITYLTKRNQYRTKKVSRNKIYAKKYKVRGVKIGDKVKGGVVVGLGRSRFVIQVGNAFYKYYYEEVFREK